ncbi:MAG: MFS transporter [Candidatus Promineofilum sp.]|nr:MFS transporter [Promineifilum sp.]
MSTTPSKAVYALYYGALACLVPYMTLYYQQKGLNSVQIGVLASIIPLITLASSPFWSAVGDATRRHRAVLLLTIAGLWAAVLLLYLVSGFPAMLAAVVLYAVFVGPIAPLVDNAVMALLGERRAQYGRVRVWGAVGWGGASLLLGPLLQRAGLGWAFYGFLFFMALCFVAASRLPMAVPAARAAYRAGLGRLLGNGRFLLLLFVALIYGVCLGAVLSYQFLFLAELGASRTLMSLTMVAATLSEMPFWFLSGPLIARFGPNKLIAFGLLMGVVRLFALAVMGAPWLALPISLLHGPSFAVLWAAGVADADTAAPAGLGATAQGLFSGALNGLGSAVGGFFGGLAWGAIGFASLFLILGWLMVGALLVFVSARMVRRARPAL